MVIRPMTSAYMAGGVAGSRNTAGGKGGPAILNSGRDTVALGGGIGVGAGLYSAAPWFKIMGSVELEVQPEDHTSRVNTQPNARQSV